MQEKYLYNVKLIIKRLKASLNFKTDRELAKYLGISQSTLSAWKFRDSIDFKLIFTKCENIDLNWLVFDSSDKEYYIPGNSISIVDEPGNKYGCNNCILKDKIIKSQEETIKALQDALNAYKKLENSS